MPPAPEMTEWELPRLRSSFQLHEDIKEDDLAEFFDVKFYPYNPPGAPPVFAATSKKHVVVVRLVQTTDKDQNPCQIIQMIRDEDASANNYTCCWSKDPDTELPWLCVAGKDAKIKVYDIKRGNLVKTLVGHGGDISDLATSPACPTIIASASDDTTIKLWSLAKEHDKQPCICILGGEGHQYNLLSVAFHNNGRYVLSAGHDQIINLWALPEFPKEHLNVPIILHFPHFSSSEVHNNLVDCVAFYGDLILSRACHEDKIVLWRIEGFSSADPIPNPLDAPTPTDMAKQTRSCFNPVLSKARPAMFTRLAQFHTPDCGVQFYMRFRMFHAKGRHPILAFANAKSKTMFWDFARFAAYRDFMEELEEAKKQQQQEAAAGSGAVPVAIQKPSWLLIKRAKKGAAAAASHQDTATSLRLAAADKDSMVSASPDPEGASAAVAAAGTATPGNYNQETLSHWKEMYDLSNPIGLIRPHKVQGVDGTFVGRQVGWSPGGEWCVVVGNKNRALIYQRGAREKGVATPIN
ncbi:WD40-repeat-containing domain protein [Triangularia verruculosa]|uniref:WD40-repeat-containing domain protein n=1 Tax=Triangularia verruculosa TaxID=2587418 RepID=A0AAN6XNM3_9PEZI|nr:WD40-repeat-containing domain protein [Triangularia verruculosa]